MRLATVGQLRRRERQDRIVRPLVMFGGLLCSTNMGDPSQLTRSRETRCDSCTRITPCYDIVNYGSIEGGYRHLCSQCFNKEVAETAGLTGFENAKFEPVGLVDSAGEVHEFHFRNPFIRHGSRARRLRALRWTSGWLPLPDHRRSEGRPAGSVRAIDRKDAPCLVHKGSHGRRARTANRGTTSRAWPD